jgi:hypothetical protein
MKVYRGNAAKIAVALTQADDTPFDPTLNADIRWSMSTTASGESLVRKSLTSGINIVAGGVEIELAGADTNFDPGVYYHELRVVDVSDVETALTGAFVIKRAINEDEISEVQAALVSFAPKVVLA